MLSKSFWLSVFLSYTTLVIGVWGFVQAYTYFQGDSLKKALGPYWVVIYLLPLPIAFFIGIRRARIKQPEPNNNVTNESEQQVQPRLNHTRKNNIIYKGLIWKPSRFGFQLPTPLCPRVNCERPVYHDRVFPPRQIISANLREMQEFLDKQNTYKNVYRCPVHGELIEVPDIELRDLRREAQFELKREVR